MQLADSEVILSSKGCEEKTFKVRLNPDRLAHICK